MRQAFGLTGSIGVFLGALSALNLTATAFRLGLSEFWEEVLGYWHKLMHETILDGVLRIIGVDVPVWLREPLVLWIIVAGICFRTLVQARNVGRAALNAEINERYAHRGFSDPVEIEGIGQIERRVFSWPLGLYLAAAALACFFLLPLIVLRLVYGDRTYFVRIPLQGQESVSLDLRYKHGEDVRRFNYATIARAQVLVFCLAYVIMLATNAGLPSAGDDDRAAERQITERAEFVSTF